MSPSHLFNIRIIQVAFAIIYLILLSYCGVHRGWWLNLRDPLAFGSAYSPIYHALSYTPTRRSTITLTGGQSWSPIYRAVYYSS